ncbi:FtsK/SpoIIIE domain-containing protein [Micrococcus luteus]
MLDTPDAFHLPPLPGFGYLKVDTSVYSRFRSGYVSSPLEDEAEAREHHAKAQTIVDEVPPTLPMPAYGPDLAGPTQEEEPELSVGRATDAEPETERLGDPAPTVMESLMDRLREVPSPVEPLWLPHVGGVAIRTNKEMVTRTLRELSGMLTLRESLFESEGIDSMVTLRRRHADGSLPQLASADIFLVLDGYGLVNEEFSELTPVLNGLIGRGAAYGIHVITAVSRQNEVRSTQQSYFSHRVELHLPSPTDSAIDRKVAERVRESTPGRGISMNRLHGQVALPRIDGDADAQTGRSSMLRQLASHLCQTHADTEMMAVVYDPRGELKGAVPDD